MSRYKSAFTVDVEDGVSIAMRDVFNEKVKQSNRVVSCTARVLNLCAKHSIKATFFVLGEVAEEFPKLIADIASGGHELGVHGYHHKQFFCLTKQEAFNELSDAKKIIEDLTGVQVKGHRAPVFSITPETRWALDVITDTGFTYDSSVMPCKGKRYGWPNFPKNINFIETLGGEKLIEVPLTTVKILGKEISAGGGGYLRLFPLKFTQLILNKVIKKRPAVLYMHPYELDTQRYPDYYFEALNNTDFLTRWNMKSKWWKRKTVYTKLDDLLGRYEFDTLSNIIGQILDQDKL